MTPLQIITETLIKGLNAPPEKAIEVRARAGQAALEIRNNLNAEDWRIVKFTDELFDVETADGTIAKEWKRED